MASGTVPGWRIVAITPGQKRSTIRQQLSGLPAAGCSRATRPEMDLTGEDADERSPQNARRNSFGYCVLRSGKSPTGNLCAGKACLQKLQKLTFPLYRRQKRSHVCAIDWPERGPERRRNRGLEARGHWGSESPGFLVAGCQGQLVCPCGCSRGRAATGTQPVKSILTDR